MIWMLMSLWLVVLVLCFVVTWLVGWVTDLEGELDELVELDRYASMAKKSRRWAPANDEVTGRAPRAQASSRGETP